MTGPTEPDVPRPARPRPAAGAGTGRAAAGRAEVPRPAPEPAPATPPPAPQRPPMPDVAATVDEVLARLRVRYTTAELLMGGGAVATLALWVLFAFLAADLSAAPPDLVMVGAAATLGILALRTTGRAPAWALGRDAIALAAAFTAFTGAMRALASLRVAMGGRGQLELGSILWWVAVAAIAAGAWLEWRGAAERPR